MIGNRRRSVLSVLFFAVLLTAFYVLLIKEYSAYPNHLKIFEGESQSIEIRFPLKLSEKQTDHNIIQLVKEGSKNNDKFFLNSLQIGSTHLDLKLFGFMPYRSMTVDVIPKIKVIPGGQSVGVRLNTKGVLVVGLEEIEGIDGKKYNPGYTAGLSIGDSILEINHQKVLDANHVTTIINNLSIKNQPVDLTVKRGDKVIKMAIQPVKSKEEGEFRLGLWVRDKTAGVGTLTFLHPDSMKFGALGHAITDIDTGLLLTVENGEVVKSRVASVEQGKRGKPGEIKGIFYDTLKPIGNLEKNTQFGIYGKAYESMTNAIYDKPMEIAFQHEIREGKATILTTLDNDEIKEYEIYIEKVNRQRNPNTKSLIIRVTDPRLLAKSGGIVQGMSGSPIIQNNKLVGAVTHVFVNDPTKGYGLFIEWMIQEADIQAYNNSKVANNE